MAEKKLQKPEGAVQDVLAKLLAKAKGPTEQEPASATAEVPTAEAAPVDLGVPKSDAELDKLRLELKEVEEKITSVKRDIDNYQEKLRIIDENLAGLNQVLDSEHAPVDFDQVATMAKRELEKLLGDRQDRLKRLEEVRDQVRSALDGAEREATERLVEPAAPEPARAPEPAPAPPPDREAQAQQEQKERIFVLYEKFTKLQEERVRLYEELKALNPERALGVKNVFEEWGDLPDFWGQHQNNPDYFNRLEKFYGDECPKPLQNFCYTLEKEIEAAKEEAKDQTEREQLKTEFEAAQKPFREKMAVVKEAWEKLMDQDPYLANYYANHFNYYNRLAHETFNEITHWSLGSLDTLRLVIQNLKTNLPDADEMLVRINEDLLKPDQTAIIPGRPRDRAERAAQTPVEAPKLKDPEVKEKLKKNPRMKKMLAQEVAKQLTLTAASVFGVKGIYTVPKYLQEHLLGGISGSKSDIGKAMGDLFRESQSQRTGREAARLSGETVMKSDRVLGRVKELEQKLKGAALPEHTRREFRQQLAEILRDSRKLGPRGNLPQYLSEFNLGEILDEYVVGKVSGIEAARDSVNLACTVGGAYAARGLAYGGLSLYERTVRLKKQKERQGEKLSFLKNVVRDGALETMRALGWQGEGSKGRKALEFIKAGGIVLRTLGISNTTISAIGSDGLSLSHELSRAIENFGQIPGKIDVHSLSAAGHSLNNIFKFGETWERMTHLFRQEPVSSKPVEVTPVPAPLPQETHYPTHAPTPVPEAPPAPVAPAVAEVYPNIPGPGIGEPSPLVPELHPDVPGPGVEPIEHPDAGHEQVDFDDQEGLNVAAAPAPASAEIHPATPSAEHTTNVAPVVAHETAYEHAMSAGGSPNAVHASERYRLEGTAIRQIAAHPKKFGLAEDASASDIQHKADQMLKAFGYRSVGGKDLFGAQPGSKYEFINSNHMKVIGEAREFPLDKSVSGHETPGQLHADMRIHGGAAPRVPPGAEAVPTPTESVGATSTAVPESAVPPATPEEAVQVGEPVELGEPVSNETPAELAHAPEAPPPPEPPPEAPAPSDWTPHIAHDTVTMTGHELGFRDYLDYTHSPEDRLQGLKSLLTPGADKTIGSVIYRLSEDGETVFFRTDLGGAHAFKEVKPELVNDLVNLQQNTRSTVKPILRELAEAYRHLYPEGVVPEAPVLNDILPALEPPPMPEEPPAPVPPVDTLPPPPPAPVPEHFEPEGHPDDDETMTVNTDDLTADLLNGKLAVVKRLSELKDFIHEHGSAEVAGVHLGNVDGRAVLDLPGSGPREITNKNLEAFVSLIKWKTDKSNAETVEGHLALIKILRKLYPYDGSWTAPEGAVAAVTERWSHTNPMEAFLDSAVSKADKVELLAVMAGQNTDSSITDINYIVNPGGTLLYKLPGEKNATVVNAGSVDALVQYYRILKESGPEVANQTISRLEK